MKVPGQFDMLPESVENEAKLTVDTDENKHKHCSAKGATELLSSSQVENNAGVVLTKKGIR